MRAPANATRPTAYQTSATAVASVSAGLNRPRSKRTRVMGTLRTTRPTAAGADT